MSIIFIITKYLAFMALSGISMLLSYNMFSQLSEIRVESILLSIVAIAIEALKIFSLVRGNTLLQLRLKTQAFRAYAMYGILAILAVLASYGYTLTVVDRGIQASQQSEVQFQIEANRSELGIVEEQIDSLESQITVAVQRQQDTPFDFITAWRNITDQINQLENQKAEFVTRRLELNSEYADLRTALAREQTETRSTVSMFRLMAESFGMSETVLMLALLLTIVILIELGIVSTSPTIPIDRKHITHILNEFAHNLHLDELEAERALERAKRQQQVHQMYEEAGLHDPNEWPLIERRKTDKEEVEAPEPNDALRTLMKEAPSESNSVGEEDISFFNALKTVLFKKSSEPEEHHPADDVPVEEPEVAPEHANLPVRQLSKPTQIEAAPSWMLPENDETISLTAEELDDIVSNATTSEERGKGQNIEEPEATPEPKEEVVEEPVNAEEASEKIEKELIVEEPVPETEKTEEPKKEPIPRRTRKAAEERRDEGAEEAGRNEESTEPPKPRRRTRPKPKRDEVSEEASDTSKDEETVQVEEPANWSSVAKETPTVAAEPETPIRKQADPDRPDELHVRSIKPQEVGETRTYRFGKTTVEVKKLFVSFIESLFKENGEEFLLDPAVACREAKIKPALGSVFIHRLEDLKGSTGLPLVTKKEDGLYYPNYTKEYIISYTTKEVNTQGRAV